MATPPAPLPSISPESPGAPPAAPKSHTLAWILGGCGTVLALAIIAGILGLRMFIKNNVHVGPGGEMDVKIPGGGQMHTGKAHDIGIPVYPEVNPGGTGMEMKSPRADQSMSMAVYVSGDALEKVDDWYRQKLGKDYLREGPGQKTPILGNRRFPAPIPSDSISYISKTGDGVKVVALTQAGTNTQILLMTTGVPAAQ